MSKKLYETSTESTFGDDSDESYLPCESRKLLKTKVLSKKKSCTTTSINAMKKEQKDSEDSSSSNKTVHNLEDNSEKSKSDNSDEPSGFNVTIRPVSESKLNSVVKGTAHDIKTKQNCIVLETLETTSQSSSVGGYLSLNPSDEEYHPGKSNRKKKFNKRKTCSIKKRKKWKNIATLIA